MKKKSVIYFTLVVFGLSLVSSTILAITPSTTHAINLAWQIMNTPTPGDDYKFIVPGSEINGLAVGSDGATFYTLDIPNSKIYKSSDGGTTWDDKLSDYLPSSASPIWSIAIAPDNPNIVAVVTNNRKQVYVFSDNESIWTNLGDIPWSGVNEIITDIAISPIYSGGRDIAVATRGNPSFALSPLNCGNIWTKRLDLGIWQRQFPLDTEDFTSLAFSKNYEADFGILAVGSTSDGTSLHRGKRDPVINKTIWDMDMLNYPVLLDEIPNNEIIFSQIQAPSDLVLSTQYSNRVYVGCDYYTGGIRKGKVYRIDDNVVRYITPPEQNEDENRKTYFPEGLSSIAYYGAMANGKLLVGMATTDATLGQVKIWRTFNPAADNPSWDYPLNLKQPTGGTVASPTYGFANAKIAWSPSGLTVYCGTATAVINDTSEWANMTLPGGPWGGASLDESAFSVSTDGAYTWNQIAFIDTYITRLSDEVIDNTGSLYLSSINTSLPGFDSIWRNDGNIVVPRWIRVFCARLSNDADLNPIILRAGAGPATGSQLALAVVGTKTIYYLLKTDQIWHNITSSPFVYDLAFSGTDELYVLEGDAVSRAAYSDSVWHWREKISIGSLVGQSIATPLKNPQGQDWVVVGDASGGRIAYADFSQKTIQFQNTVAVPGPGKMHVLCSENFDSDKIIYAASESGQIYRWIMGNSTGWDDLKSRNSFFFGLTQKSGTLYGVWRTGTDSGADRTLEPGKTDIILQPPEWDQLVTGIDSNVQFTRGPDALKSSSNEGTFLWAIDNRNYVFGSRTGCLWYYGDTMSTAQTTSITPEVGDLIPADPVTGRNAGINLAWQDIAGAVQYELWLTKDPKFTLAVSQQIVIPYVQAEPALILPPGMLETNHQYYWRVRATRAYTGEFITSPWSPTLFFTVMQGLPVVTPYLTPMALAPKSGACSLPVDNAGFSWTAFNNTDFYNFQLADNPEMTMPIVNVQVPTTAFLYSGKLDNAKNYYWRVMASSPAPSEWSPVFSFSTVPAPQPASNTASLLAAREQLRMQVSIWLVISIIVMVNVAVLIYILRR